MCSSRAAHSALCPHSVHHCVVGRRLLLSVTICYCLLLQVLKQWWDAVSGGAAKAASTASGALGHYFGGEDEGGPWQKFPQLVRGGQKVLTD